jgi:hypothetical protein
MRLRFTFLLLLGFILPIGLHAQAPVVDSVVSGAGFAKTNFYSLNNGEVYSHTRAGWDIAFKIAARSAGLLLNTSKGNRLFLASSDTTQFLTLLPADTAGVVGANQSLWNTDTSWEWGAFNLASTVTGFDYGWGSYNIATNTLIGSRIYYLKLANNSWKKIFIRKLNPIGTVNKYWVRYANLDNTGDTTVVWDRSAQSGKLFGYWSFDSVKTFINEPAATTWDLQFVRYNPGDGQYIPAAGVLHNQGVKVAKLTNVDTATVTYSTAVAGTTTYSEFINTIGWNWKDLNQQATAYVPLDSIAYIIKLKNGEFWKLVFTGYKISRGFYGFVKQKLVNTTSVDPANANNFSLALYPNPATISTSLIVDSPIGATTAELKITDVTGRVYSTREVALGNGLSTISLDTNNLSQGLYFVQLSGSGMQQSLKLAVTR